MTKPTPALTKTCSVCGLQKPLSAFLQITEHGTTYGSVCSACRHDQKNKDRLKKAIDDTSGTSTGRTIDTKVRVESEKDKKDLREQEEEDYHKERDENEIKDEALETRELDKSKKEKEHREHFLSRRPASTSDKKTDSTRAIESRQQIERASLETVATEKATQLDQATKDELKEKGIDFTVPFRDTEIVGKVKHTQNPELLRLLERERGLAIRSIFGQRPQATSTPQQQPTIQKENVAPKQNNATSVSTSFLEKSQTNKPEKLTNETPSQDAENRWGPGSRR